MNVERRILEGVARADIILCAALRGLAIIAGLAIVLLAVLAARRWVSYDPYFIDYDAPGVDITSEGP